MQHSPGKTLTFVIYKQQHGTWQIFFPFLFLFLIFAFPRNVHQEGTNQLKRSKQQQQKYKEPTKHFLCSDCSNFLFAFRSEICTQQHDNDKGRTSEPMKKKLPKRNEHHQPPPKDRPLHIGLPDVLQT